MEVKKARFDWMAAAMPGVVKLAAEKRAQWGDAHVTECIQRGLAGEPGFFFAREGPIAVGTPFETDPVIIDAQWRTYSKTQAMLMLRNPPEAPHGPHP